MAFKPHDGSDVYDPVNEYPNWDHWNGGGLYRGIPTMQNKQFIPAFTELFSRTNITRILEVGTADGGLIHAITDVSDVEVVTYDVRMPRHVDKLADKNINIVIKDIFTDLDFAKRYIQLKGQTLVLCDGGDKPREFHVLSSYLKEGDIIMAHDYCRDPAMWDGGFKQTVWPNAEITYGHIEHAVKKNNLQGFMTDEFQSAAWTCWKK
jgi:hypothetical protein